MSPGNSLTCIHSPALYEVSSAASFSVVPDPSPGRVQCDTNRRRRFRVTPHLALRVCERAEPDLLQRGGPGGRGTLLLAELVAPAPPGGGARTRPLLLRAAEAGVGLEVEKLGEIQTIYLRKQQLQLES